MNAFNNINLAGACILTSTEYAKELRIPKDRWIYPLGGAGTSDSSNCMCHPHLSSLFKLTSDAVWERPNFYSSPSISRSLDAGLEISGLAKDNIDTFDFYSFVPLNILHRNILTFVAVAFLLFQNSHVNILDYL